MFKLARHFAFFAKINYQKRQLIGDLIGRDFKIRYLGSLMGSYWNFIHPLAMIAIYTIIFSKVMKVKLGTGSDSPFEFTLYLCAGLLPWTAFQEMVIRGSNQFNENADFIKKIAFPKEILQSIASGSALLTLLISLSLYFLLIMFSGHGMTWAVLVLPYIVFCQILFASGLGLTLGVFNVFLKDVQQMLAIIFQIWFWLTPIIYSIDRVPEAYRKILILNPFLPFAHSYQKVFVQKEIPDQWALISCLIVGVLSLMVGVGVYFKFKDQIADEL